MPRENAPLCKGLPNMFAPWLLRFMGQSKSQRQCGWQAEGVAQVCEPGKVCLFGGLPGGFMWERKTLRLPGLVTAIEGVCPG